MSRNRTCVNALLTCACFWMGTLLQAQNAPPQADQSSSSIDQELHLLRQDLRAQRKQIVAANMNLTAAEAEKFWPIYDQFIAELVQRNQAKYELIKQAAEGEKLTDELTETLPKRWLSVDESVDQLRLKYIPIFRNVLSARSTARFYQIDRRVQLMIDLQLASSLPLIEP